MLIKDRCGNMLTKKDFADCIYNVLTPLDLYEKMAPLITPVKSPGVIINYSNGHFLIGHERFQDGLSVSTDCFGVWEMTRLIAMDDGSYQFTDTVLKTERTETVVRALASLIISWQEQK
jgi:hypothetical protein